MITINSENRLDVANYILRMVHELYSMAFAAGLQDLAHYLALARGQADLDIRVIENAIRS